jgi:hypothetical protein
MVNAECLGDRSGLFALGNTEFMDNRIHISPSWA